MVIISQKEWFLVYQYNEFNDGSYLVAFGHKFTINRDTILYNHAIFLILFHNFGFESSTLSFTLKKHTAKLILIIDVIFFKSSALSSTTSPCLFGSLGLKDPKCYHNKKAGSHSRKYLRVTGAIHCSKNAMSMFIIFFTDPLSAEY